jgi:hypothetical protein
MVTLPPSALVDDRLAAFDSTPLFMKSLPTEDSDDSAISALQSLAYEGTPDGWLIWLSLESYSF